MHVTKSAAIMNFLRVYCNYEDCTFYYSYVGGSFCSNHACGCFCCNYAVISFCSTYASNGFCIEYVGDDFYCIYVGESLRCNYAGVTFCNVQLFLLENAGYYFCYSYAGDTFKQWFYILSLTGTYFS